MPLTGEQKNYIKKNIWQSSPEDVADYLNIPEKEVLNFLKKRWNPEKYEKYLSRFSKSSETETKNFNFNRFFKENWFILALLSALVAITYLNSLGNAFVSDDISAISGNPDLGNFSKFVFSAPFGFLQRISYFISFKLGGLTPNFFHLFSIFIHLGTTLLVFFVLYLIAPRTLAIMAAALFAVHPVLSESVTWISGGSYAQGGLFFLASLAAYILAKQKPIFYYISVIAFALSVSASEKGMVLCAAFLAYELALGDIRKNWKKLIPFFAIGIAVAIFLLSKVGGRVSSLQTTYYLAPGMDSLLVKIPTSIAMYFKLIFWPSEFTLYHTEMLFTPWQYRFTVLVFLVYAASIIYFWRKNKFVSFWLVFFILPLLPTLSPMRIAWAVAERYAYIGVLGILVFIAWVFFKVSRNKKFQIITFMVFWLVIGGLAMRTIIRNRDWKTEESLWFATAKTSPSGPNIHNNLGYIYFRKGEYEKAIGEFSLAIKINPAYGDAYHNLGNTYYQMQKVQEAAQSYHKAIELNPNLWQSHQNLASIYYNQGWYDLAGEELKKALEVNPGSEDLKKNMNLIESSKQTVPSPDVNSLFGD